jgi:hypothetical protein
MHHPIHQSTLAVQQRMQLHLLSVQPGSTAPSFASNSHKEPDKPHIEPSTLNSDQTVAATKIFAGSNAFLTGAAGVGKFYLLNYLIKN